MKWTPEIIARLKELEIEGKTPNEVSDIFLKEGITTDSGDKLDRNRIALAAKYYGINLKNECKTWTDEMDEKLLKLLKAGHTCKDIASLLTKSGYKGMNKNTIIGRAHRLDIAKYSHHTYKRAKNKEILPRHIEGFDQIRGCQYPYGEPGKKDFYFCGESDLASSSSYCQEHDKICHTKSGRAEVLAKEA